MTEIVFKQYCQADKLFPQKQNKKGDNNFSESLKVSKPLQPLSKSSVLFNDATSDADRNKEVP